MISGPSCALRRQPRASQEFLCQLFCLLRLTLLFLVTYSANMVVSEVLDTDSLIAFILVKYSFGMLHNLLCPVIILGSYKGNIHQLRHVLGPSPMDLV